VVKETYRRDAGSERCSPLE